MPKDGESCPLGLFKKLAIHNIQKIVDNYHEMLADMGVDIKNVFEITLHEQYEEPVQDSQGWKLPPFEIKYKDQAQIKIVGTLAEVSEKGLIANIYGDKNDVTKSWGEFVILNCLIERYQLPIQKQLLCSKSGKVKNAYFNNALHELEQILDYYFQSLHNVSPLTGEWLHDLVHHDSDTLQKAMNKSLNDPFNPMRNEYIKWVCRKNNLDAANMIEHWQPKARELFSSLYQAWIGKDE